MEGEGYSVEKGPLPRPHHARRTCLLTSCRAKSKFLPATPPLPSPGPVIHFPVALGGALRGWVVAWQCHKLGAKHPTGGLGLLGWLPGLSGPLHGPPALLLPLGLDNRAHFS